MPETFDPVTMQNDTGIKLNAAYFNRLESSLETIDDRLAAQEFDVSTVTTVAYAASVTINAATGSLFRITAVGDVALLSPINGVDDQRIRVQVLASGISRTITFPATQTSSQTVPADGYWLGELRYIQPSNMWVLVDQVVADSASSAASIPGAPLSVSATRGNGSATVSFSSPLTDGGAAISGYTVTSSPGAITATGSTSPIVVTGLTNGTAYTFTVRATNSIGQGPASAPSTSVTPATVPAAPAIGTVIAGPDGSGQVTVSFTAPTDTGGVPITSFTALSNPDGKIATGSASPLTVSGLTVGTAYTFTVTATNEVGTGAASSASASVTPPGGGPVVVTTSDSSVRRAQEFADSVGVSVHWNYPAYSNIGAIKTALDYTGITRTRGGPVVRNAAYANYINANMPYLRFCLVASPTDWGSTSAADQIIALRNAGILDKTEWIEGPNEWDLAGVGGTSAEAANYIRQVSAAYRAAGVKVGSPTMANTVPAQGFIDMGNLNAYCDAMAFHPYPGDAYAMTDTIMSTYMAVNGKRCITNQTNLPTITTETGFASSPSGDQGKSMPPSGPFTDQHINIWLELFRGIPGQMTGYRNFKYELKDQGTGTVEATFGLFDTNWVAKPVATAVKNMLALVKDPAANALSFTPVLPAGFSITGGNAVTRNLKMQKADGSWLIAVWQQARTWNGTTIEAPATPSVTVSWTGSASYEVYRPATGSNTTATTLLDTRTSTGTGTSVTITSAVPVQIIKIAGAVASNPGGGGGAPGGSNPATIRSSTTATSIEGFTSHTITKPTGTVSGDRLVLVSFLDPEGVNSVVTSSGFAKVGQTSMEATGNGTGGLITVLEKTAGGSEPASYTVAGFGGGASAVSVLLAITGHHATNTWGVLPTYGTTAGSSSAPVAPAIAAAAGELALFGFTSGAGSAYTYSAGASGLTEVAEAQSSWRGGSVYSLTIAATGSTGTKTVTTSAATTDHKTVSLAINPAS